MSASAFAHATTGSLLAASTSYGDLAMAQEAPMSLTASDGSGLELVKLEAHAVVQGPLAYTELHLYFHNPEDRIREGTFTVTLPSGAALSRFAMRNEQGWMEAEVVEKMAARRAYEDFLHRKQDPALLEQAAGNQFSARVFPIPAKGDKHLVISYSQELTATGQPYVLPLRGLPTVGAVDASVMIAAAGSGAPRLMTQALSQRSWKPDRDFVVATGTGSDAVAAVGSGEFVAARVKVPGELQQVAMGSLAILVDSSASRALGYHAQVETVRKTIAALRMQYGDGFMLDVAAFDQDVQPIFHGRAADFGDAEVATLVQRQALGASNLGAALDWLATASTAERVLVMGDGVVTAGVDTAALAAKVKALATRGARRLDVALFGAIHDRDGARGLAAAGLRDVGVVIEVSGADAAGELGRRMSLPVRSDLAIGVDGATWAWPTTAAQAQPGDEVVVYAAMASTKAAHTATIRLGTAAVTVPVQAADRPLVSRAAAQAEIARLEAARDAAVPAARQAVRDQIVNVSVAQRVLSSETALLVLETEADYQRFGIVRTALADILVVGDTGLRLEQRATPVVMIASDVPAATKEIANRGPQEKADQPATMASERDGVDDESAIAESGTLAAAAPAPMDADDAPRPGLAPRPTSSTAPRGEGRTADVERVSAHRTESGAAAGAVAAPQRLAVESRPVVRDDEHDDRRSDGGGDGNDSDSNDSNDSGRGGPPALTGRLKTIVDMIGKQQLDAALREAMAWHTEAPGDVLALLGLGEAFEARGEVALAARAYGSIIDLFPARVDLRRFAGERLERLGMAARDLITDTYQRAVDDRPDHLSGHRMLAMSLVRAGKTAEAFAAIERGLTQAYPDERFRGGERILRDDLGLVAAAWIAREPARRAEILKRVDKLGASVASRPSTRFVLYWETDGNDVDFHIRDAKGGHAYYSDMTLPSGGELYADVTTGYGPECFTIDGLPTAGPYQLEIHYYSRGPMGYGMGVLEILRHDGHGGLTFEHRPYVAMNDQAFVELGSISTAGRGAAQMAK